MKATGIYQHDADNMHVALGIKRSPEQMNAIAFECMHTGHNERFSVALAKAIELCESPEEVAYIVTVICRRIATEPQSKGLISSLLRGS